MKNIINKKPMAWQKDQNQLETKNVQLWQNGNMVGLISLQKARGMVNEGSAFVITGQAIGTLVNGFMRS